MYSFKNCLNFLHVYNKSFPFYLIALKIVRFVYSVLTFIYLYNTISIYVTIYINIILHSSESVCNIVYKPTYHIFAPKFCLQCQNYTARFGYQASNSSLLIIANRNYTVSPKGTDPNRLKPAKLSENLLSLHYLLTYFPRPLKSSPHQQQTKVFF